ncbi:MAG: hypothetical protein NVSMB9_25330 [Isosphaeraceae bacterium]
MKKIEQEDYIKGDTLKITIVDDEDKLDNFDDSSAFFVKDGNKKENVWKTANYNYDPSIKNKATLDITVGEDQGDDGKEQKKETRTVTTGKLTVTLQKKGTATASSIVGKATVTS